MARELAELAAALAAFQAEVPVIPKKQTAKVESERGKGYTYTYADLASIAPVVMPLLAKHGLAFTALPTSGKGDGPRLVGMLLHSSGQYVTGELPITGRGPQEIGSSLTYGRRYLLGCLTGVVTDDDDDDGRLAQRGSRTRSPERPPGVTPEADPPPPVVPIQRKRRQREEPAPGPGESPHGSTGPPMDQPPGAGSGPDPSVPERMSDAQRRAMFAAIGHSFPDSGRAERLALCTAIVGRPVASSNDLGPSEGSAIINWLDGYLTGWNGWTYDPDTESGHVFRREPEEPPPDDGGA